MISQPFRRLGRGSILLGMVAIVAIVLLRPQIFTGPETTAGTRGLPRADVNQPRTQSTAPAGEATPDAAVAAAAGATPAAAPTPSPEMLASFERISTRLEADSRDLDAWMELGAILIEAKDYGRAAEAYAAAVDVAPDRADAHGQLAKALLFEGMVYVARVEIRRALALDPNSAEANLNLGITYSHATPADIDAARVAWNRTVELEPDSESARQAREYLKAYSAESGEKPTRPPGH